jgi:hypothetical protein
MREHQHTFGVKDKAISNNIGGNSSKIYFVVDADGNPTEFIINDSKTPWCESAPDFFWCFGLKKKQEYCVQIGVMIQNYLEKNWENRNKANILKKCKSESSNKHMDWCLYKNRYFMENALTRLKIFTRNSQSVWQANEELWKLRCFSLYLYLVTIMKCQQTLTKIICLKI